MGQVADFAHGRLLDLFDANAANDACDRRTKGIGLGGILEEGFEIDLFLQRGVQLSLAVAGKPADDRINLRLGASLLFRFCEIVGINIRNAGGEDAMLGGHGIGKSNSRWATPRASAGRGHEVNTALARAVTVPVDASGDLFGAFSANAGPIEVIQASFNTTKPSMVTS
jgi:hypothetical protein